MVMKYWFDDDGDGGWVGPKWVCWTPSTITTPYPSISIDFNFLPISLATSILYKLNSLGRNVLTVLPQKLRKIDDSAQRALDWKEGNTLMTVLDGLFTLLYLVRKWGVSLADWSWCDLLIRCNGITQFRCLLTYSKYVILDTIIVAMLPDFFQHIRSVVKIVGNWNRKLF